MISSVLTNYERNSTILDYITSDRRHKAEIVLTQEVSTHWRPLHLHDGAIQQYVRPAMLTQHPDLDNAIQ